MIHSELQGQKYSLVFFGVVFESLQKKRPMNKYNNELAKNSLSMINGLAEQAAQQMYHFR